MNYNSLANSTRTPESPLTTNSSSTWQQFVVGASSAAGSTVAVVSEESMKCLKYCLSWLQYAIHHIAQQMNVLRSFLVSLATSPNKEKEHSVTILSSIKQDLVSTLRKVIDIITCYANNALPSQAKATVRGTILSLPSRWAYMYDSTTTVDQADNIELQQQTSKEVRIAPYKQEDVALRLLTFGQESSNMLTSIHNVFEDTIQRAENWLEKLRMINPMSSSNETYSKKLLPLPNIDNNGTSSYIRNNNHNPRTPIRKDSEDEEDFCDVLLPPILNLHISSSPISNPSSN